MHFADCALPRALRAVIGSVMSEDHVPPIGPRYWAIFLVAGVLGTQLGDALPIVLPIGVPYRLLVLAVLIAALFLAERYARSPTELWYWGAVILIQVTAVRLRDFSTIDLGVNLLAMAGSLAVLMVTTMMMARSGDAHLYATMQLERPGTEVKPVADAAYWLGLIFASTLGAVTADLCSKFLRIGLYPSVGIMSLALAVLLYLQRRSRPNPLRAFWVTIILMRSDAAVISDAMIEGPSVNLGLMASTALTACLMIGLLVLWRPRTPLAG
jgi:uncharacterized membrane-anchored protein